MDTEDTSAGAGSRARWMCAIGFLTAASFLLMAVSVAMPHAPYLRYDPSDVPALVAACAMGPSAGLLVVALRNLLRFLLANPDLIGLSMNLFASGTFVWVTGVLYSRTLTRRGAILALACGTLASSAVMVWANSVVLPRYLGFHPAKVVPILLLTILPFNLVKGLVNSVLVFVLYKDISPVLPRNRVPPEWLMVEREAQFP